MRRGQDRAEGDLPMQRRTFLGTMAAVAMSGAATPPLRLGMAGLEHGHAAGFLARYRDSKDVELVGIAEPDRDVAARYIKRSRLDPATIYPSLEAMLDQAKPQAVVAFTSTAGHLAVVAACAAPQDPGDDGEAARRQHRAGPRHRACRGRGAASPCW